MEGAITGVGMVAGIITIIMGVDMTEMAMERAGGGVNR